MKSFPFITLNSGELFHYGDPKSRVSTYDMAYHLSRIPRFAGATDGEPYSVGQHSVMVYDLLVSWKARPQTCAYGLYHDAHEILSSDMPTPYGKWLAELAGFDVVEHSKLELDRCIFASVGLPYPMSEGDHQLVKKADYTALVAEASQLFVQRPIWLEDWRIAHDVDKSAYDIPVEVLKWKDAENLFLRAAAQVSQKMAA